MEDLISIILPVYKVEKYIDKCMESLINQTYKNLEIILVDDGSPDNSGKLCDEWSKKDKRVKVIHKENGGVSSARNAGLDAATGDYIAFIDPDDWVDLETYEKMLNAIINGYVNSTAHEYALKYSRIFKCINHSYNDGVVTTEPTTTKKQTYVLTTDAGKTASWQETTLKKLHQIPAAYSEVVSRTPSPVRSRW